MFQSFIEEKLEIISNPSSNPSSIQAHTGAVEHAVSYAQEQDKEVDTKHLLALLGDHVWDWNLLTNEMTFSSGFQTLLGYADNAFSHRIEEWFKLMHPSDASTSVEKMRSCVEGNENQFEDEHRLKCQDGTWKKVRVRGAVAARTLKGRAARLQGFISAVSVVNAVSEVRSTHHQMVTTEQTPQKSFSALSNFSQQLPNIVFFQLQRFPGGRCVFPYASDAVDYLHGVTALEIEHNAAALFDKVHVDDIENVRQQMKASAMSLHIWDLNYRVSLAQGEKRLSGAAFPNKQSDDSVIWHGYLVDTSEQYFHQVQTESIKLHLQKEFPFKNIGSFDIDIQTGKTTFSQDFSDLLGISFEYLQRHEEFWAFFWKECIHPDDVEMVRQAHIAHFKSRGVTPYQVQFRVRSANGDWRYLSAAGIVIEWDKQGKALRMVGTHIDITERKNQELERRHFEDLLRSGRDRYKHLASELELLLTHTPVGIMLVHNGKILRANTTLAQLFAYRSAKVMLGLSIPDLHESEQAYQKIHHDVQARFKQERFADLHCVLKKEDGSLFNARLIGRVLPLEQFEGASVWVIEERS